MTATRRSLLKASALVLYLGPAQLARGATILAVRVWPANDYTRVTIESDVPLQTQVQFIEEPPRLAVDIQGLVLDESLRNLVRQVRPHQVTFVPDAEDQFTSDHGWTLPQDAERLKPLIREAQDLGVRVSLFVDPKADAIRWAKAMGADRVELYTEPFARAFERGPDAARASFGIYSDAAVLAHTLGLGVNAGHDLDFRNLTLFRSLPHLDEVSIGHAVIADALTYGMAETVRRFRHAINDR